MHRRSLNFICNGLKGNSKASILISNSISSSKVFINGPNSLRKLNSSHARCFSTSNNLERVNFEDVKCYQNDKSTLIIDVREPNELVEHGIIPESINIPLGDVEQTLRDLSEDQFFKKYRRNKPDKNTAIVFSCMRGIRSEKSQIIAQQLGFKNVKNYLGGWTDWAEKNKQ